MQPHFIAAIDILRSNPAALLGYVLVGAVGLQTLLAVVAHLRRLAHQRNQFRLERERLEYQVRAARAQWRTAELEQTSWKGWRKFRVAAKAHECEEVFSFQLEPHDGRAIPGFKPGQYLTFGLEIPGQEKQVIRCYSISEASAAGTTYRVTIKREAKPGFPPGLASSYFCDRVAVGDILNVKAPTGHFFVELEKESPVVLIGAGVGVTPVLCMAQAITLADPRREVWFFFVCRNSSDYMLRKDIEALAGRSSNLRILVCFSRPGPADVKGRDFHHEGRLTADLIKSLIPSANYDFYLCGNGAFMKDMFEGLTGWGVPESRIHFEAFGPATIKKTSDTMRLRKEAATAAPVDLTVTFARSGRQLRWDPKAGNLLEFARAEGVRIDSGCCAGSCGSCLVAIKSGTVEYLSQPDAEPEAGSCLTCICRPSGNLVLDA